ncbi:MAG TPA: hypothetical protein DF637_07150, partial [Rikenellaceae bacterium]|nr:hypothetical protein [Rikenellaceae bacterium]
GSLKKAISVLFRWTLIVAAISTVAYALADEFLFRLMTNNHEVLASAAEYLPWLLIVPLLSCTAFILDGIFIGATASKAIRDTMLLSAASFFITFYTMENLMGLQALYLAYMVHLVVRTVMMSLLMKRKVLSKAVA